ncbi:MAG: hypothetical protein KDB23_04955, partial [Planctomycetales bacterium]|nr:hypothetical protein [Planctomycetales bacterium]
LAYYNVPVDQLTYLDPHDFDQGLVVDSAQRLSGLGAPNGYGATVWNNVAFADVYYQTRGKNGGLIADQLVPQGRPIPGAANFLIDTTNYLPTGDYDPTNVFGDDEYLWAGFYLSTVNGKTPTVNESEGRTDDTPAPATAIPTNDIGYAYSRVKSTATRPDETFYVNPDRGAWQTGTLYRENDRVQFGGSDYIALRTHTSRNTGVTEPAANSPPDATFWQLSTGPFVAQDHRNSPTSLVDRTAGTPNQDGLIKLRLTPEIVTSGSQASRWNPLEIVNGDFTDIGDLIGFDTRNVPGWSDFGSAPQFDPPEFPVDIIGHNATLNADQPGITHNRLYVPAEAERLVIDLKVTHFSGNDRFEVLLGNTVLVEEEPDLDDVSLFMIDADFVKHRYVIPASLQNQVHDLTLRLTDGGDGAFNAEVKLDNIRFEGYLFEVLAGDVSLIDLGQLLGGNSFALLPPNVLDAGQAIPAKTIDNAEANFADTGRLYFIPDFETDGSSFYFDDDNGAVGDEQLARIRFQVDFGAGLVEKTAVVRVVDGYSQTGDNSVILTGSVGESGINHKLDIYRVQQRLRYFNARGKNDAEVEADGIAGSITKEAIRIFQAATQEDGKGDPAQTTFFVDGRVDLGYRTIRWLNSPVAPFWGETRTALRNRIDFEDEGFGPSWSRRVLERAIADRPELMRISDAEEFGLLNLSEFPDNGPTFHSSPSNKGGNTIDWELDQAALTGPGTGTDPINFSVPFDVNQAALTGAERDVIQDVMAFVTAAQQVGVQVWRVNVGGTGGAPSYERIRESLTALGVPNVQAASGRDKYITVHLLPPQAEFELPQPLQDALLATLSALRDNGSAAILHQTLLQSIMPFVEQSIAESLDLEKMLDLGLHQPTASLFQTNTAPDLHDLQASLSEASVQEDNLLVELTDVQADVDRTGADPMLSLSFTLHGWQLNDINEGGNLPQNAEGSNDNVMNARSSASNLAVAVVLPLEIRIPLDYDAAVDPPTDVKVVPGAVSVQATSVNLRDYDASIGVMPVEVNQGPVVLDGKLELQFTEVDENGELTLEQLNDPFLNDAITATPTVNVLTGTLPIEHTLCSILTPGADPQLTISSLDIFNGLPAIVTSNADLSPLEIFNNLTNIDILGFLNSLTTTLRRISTGLDLPEGLPFVDDALSSLIDVGDMVGDLVNELTTGTDVFFENFQDLLDRLQVILGATAEELNLRCDTATNAVLLDLNLSREYDLPVPLDFGTSLGPLNVAASAEAELFANVEAKLTLGFDFNASTLTPAQYLATPLADLNGNTGVETGAGTDFEIVLPNSVIGFSDVAGELFSFMPASPDKDLYKEELNHLIVSDELKQEFANLGHTLSN